MHPEKYIPSFFHISFYFKVFRDLKGFWTYNRQVISLWKNLTKDSDLKYCFLDTQCFLQLGSVKLSLAKSLHFIFTLWTKKNCTNCFTDFLKSWEQNVVHGASLRAGDKKSWFKSQLVTLTRSRQPKLAQPLQRVDVCSVELGAATLVKQ